MPSFRQLAATLAALAFTTLHAPADPFPQPPSIKGLQVQMNDDALALGIHHAGINVNLSGIVDFAASKGSGPSRQWAFNDAYLKSLDAQIRPLSDKGILVYAILLVYPTKDPARDAVLIHPGARKDYNYTVGAFNAETDEGKSCLSAVMSTLAARWNGKHPDHGTVRGWIVGNEVNSHWLWYNLGLASLPDAVAAYERAFRTVASAVLAKAPDDRLYIPFDHHWAISMAGISPNEATPGRDFLDAFAARIHTNGDLPWHVAWHPYPEDLGTPRVGRQIHQHHRRFPQGHLQKPRGPHPPSRKTRSPPRRQTPPRHPLRTRLPHASNTRRRTTPGRRLRLRMGKMPPSPHRRRLHLPPPRRPRPRRRSPPRALAQCP